jgi:hypothetical protein
VIVLAPPPVLLLELELELLELELLPPPLLPSLTVMSELPLL